MIDRGAEAVLRREGDRLIKERISKGYRHPQIDTALRQERTEQEARLLEKARQAGVSVPEVHDKDTYTITMSFIDGTKLRDIFEEREEDWPRIGQDIGRLHGRDIIHGDLTTSNMLLDGDKLYFIDFGLGFFSQRVEDRATDLQLLRQVLESTHTAVADEAFDTILKAYQDQYEDGASVLERLEEVASRGRYKG
ncbi:MAG: KEOPS complex kinase/ATPase Bud32 [Candidatus Nanohaloarchaea archaeon]|nr:KEOPS complex kinase/ATPase Bud32 [Candidatus Nanohaloarchaea archaeon]